MSNQPSSDVTVPTARAAHSPPQGDGAPNASSPKKRGAALSWILLVALLAGGTWMFHFVRRAMNFEETDNAYLIRPMYQVSSRAAGSATEVEVKENEVVKSGQVLARLDPLPIAIALQKAKASLARETASVLQTQAALAGAQAQHAQAEAQQASSEAQVRQTEAQLQIAKVNSERSQRLFQKDLHAVSRAEVDSTEGTTHANTAALAGARADQAAAQAKVAASAAALESAQAEIATAEARMAAESAGVRDAERQLADCAIVAPADGQIGKKNLEVGNRVQAGQALFALVGGECWIVANFKETQIKNMRPGQPVEIRIDAIDGPPLQGQLESIAPATGAQFALLPADNATGNFTKVVQRVAVKIVFSGDTLHQHAERLRAGLSAQVSVSIQ